MAVKLEKSGDQYKVNLNKENVNGKKEILINLNWSKETGKKGFFQTLFGQNKEIDLDLGCYYKMINGEYSVIDGVQFSHGRGGGRDKKTNQGCYTQSPFIWHKGDDRGNVGTESGENIYVNPAGINFIERMTIYTFIYDGVSNWEATDAVITVKVPGNEDIVVEMGKQNDKRKFCAIAELLFDGQNSITVKKLVTFHNGHKECDEKYGWGLQWTTGSKD